MRNRKGKKKGSVESVEEEVETRRSRRNWKCEESKIGKEWERREC